jgi:cupin fold WbuC family metalloprotein
MSPVLIDRQLIEVLLEKAGQSPRRRTNHNFHTSMEAVCHRFLNVMLRGTYVRPHRHTTPPKEEGFLLLEGALDLILFNDAGEVTARHRLGAGGSYGIDIPAGAWHTLEVISDHAICYEVKPGPWSAATDKDFAAWAPPEGDPRVANYQRSWAPLS